MWYSIHNHDAEKEEEDVDNDDEDDDDDVDNDEDEEDDDMFYEERTGDGNVTFSDKLPPTLLNHAKMMAIESISLKDFLFVNMRWKFHNIGLI